MANDYSAAAARKIVGVSQRCLDYWDERGIVVPSGQRATGKGSERRYSYEDLLKLSVVKRLREAGLTLQKIRKGLSKLRKDASARDPLVAEVLITDGNAFHRVTNDPSAVEDILANGQLVFSVVAIGRIDQNLRESVIRLENRIPARGHKMAKVKRKAR
jgi:DNA-binding transcriptional MerR regulator